MEPGTEKPKVYLVGAGPGRPDLITVRGAELIGIADCVIVDKLANPALLALVREDLSHWPPRPRMRSCRLRQGLLRITLVLRQRGGAKGEPGKRADGAPSD